MLCTALNSFPPRQTNLPVFSRIRFNIYTASDPLELAVQEPSDVLYGLFFTACGLPADTRPSSIASFMPRWTPCASTGWYLSTSTYTGARIYIYTGRLSRSLANIQPKLYAVTGELEYRAEDLAVGTSAFISNCTRLSRQMWANMGTTVCLHRSYKLHMTRIEQLFCTIPQGHSPKSYCSDAGQNCYRLACTRLFWKVPGE